MRPAPGSGQAEIWYCFYDEIREPSLLDRYDALMNDEERARHRRLYFARDRHQFLVTRALVRTVLSRYAPVAPSDWTFRVGAYGRPFVTGPLQEPRLFFNLSNTRGLVACAVSGAHEAVGVDVEAMDRRTEPAAIAHRFFSPFEVSVLSALPLERQRERFFSYWTLKESYIKARGLGLAIPLGKFSFELDRGSDIGIRFEPDLDDDPRRWRFALLRASERHLLAVALDTAGAAMSVRAKPCVPLAED